MSKVLIYWLVLMIIILFNNIYTITLHYHIFYTYLHIYIQQRLYELKLFLLRLIHYFTFHRRCVLFKINCKIIRNMQHIEYVLLCHIYPEIHKYR